MSRAASLGRPLKLIIEDDGSLPDSAVPAAERLVDEHTAVLRMIGNLLSNSRIAVVVQVAEPRQRIPLAQFLVLRRQHQQPLFFPFCRLPNQQIDKMIPFMARRYGLKMFFAGNNYEWPRGSIDAAKRALLQHGGDIVGEEYLPIGAALRKSSSCWNRLPVPGADVFVPYFAGLDQIDPAHPLCRNGPEAADGRGHGPLR
jgi:ABC-type branched-subunit amino acid transport system substrate-binding protein